MLTRLRSFVSAAVFLFFIWRHGCVAAGYFGPRFPNLDCIGSAAVDALFYEIDLIQEALIALLFGGSIYATGWKGMALERRGWMSYAVMMFEQDKDDLIAECPTSLYLIQVLRWGLCMMATWSGHYIRYVGCYDIEALADSFQFFSDEQVSFKPGQCARRCEEAGFADIRHIALLAGRCGCGLPGSVQEERRHPDDRCGGRHGQGAVHENVPYASIFAVEAPAEPAVDGPLEVAAFARLSGQCAELRVHLGAAAAAVGEDSPHGLNPLETLFALQNSRFGPAFTSFAFEFRNQAELRPLSAYRDPLDLVGTRFDCPRSRGREGMGWSMLREWMMEPTWDEATDEEFHLHVWTNRQFLLQSNELLEECPLGYMRLMLSLQATALRRSLKLVEPATERVLSVFNHLQRTLSSEEGALDTLSVLMHSRWSSLVIFCRMVLDARHVGRISFDFSMGGEDYQHKPYRLDFWEDEITDAGRLAGQPLEALAALPPRQHEQLLREAADASQQQHSPAGAAVIAALAAVLSAEPDIGWSKVVLVNVLWGKRYTSYLGPYLERSRALGLGSRHLIFALDGDVLDACREARSGERAGRESAALCVPGTVRGIFQKYSVLAVILNAGFDILSLDFDLVLMQNPLPYVLAAADREAADLLVTRDLGTECVNVGVFYARATPVVANFLVDLLAWMWRHPYASDQVAFGGFLGAQSLLPDRSTWTTELPEAPRWAVLDPTARFATAAVYDRGLEGWTGLLEDVVVFHFLDGGGGVNADTALAGKYVNMFDLFYANPSLNLSSVSVPLWLQDDAVRRALLASWLPEAPKPLRHCDFVSDMVDSAMTHLATEAGR
eukprot:TRINITY_DN17872_c1_g2_i1.p1 TRINITY_DN17872_c1_g2~~TRINITY_DN17872_c1_g2_i1.p1  ORF type:complete len:839 (+),score=176.02 TRINITY_DN17872_c1_g2_i1:87-2603(+)